MQFLAPVFSVGTIAILLQFVNAQWILQIAQIHKLGATAFLCPVKKTMSIITSWQKEMEKSNGSDLQPSLEGIRQKARRDK